MKRLISLFALIAVVATMALAHDFEVDGLRYEINSDGTSVTVYGTGNSGAVVIPESVEDSEGSSYSVTTIGWWAFDGCSGLTSVTIPNSVTSIGNSAFYGCRGLTSATIPNSVTQIGSYAFRECSGLTSIVVESGNSKYDSRDNCNAIIETSSNMLIVGCNNTTIPNSVTSIGDYAFIRCSGLTSVTIPNSVTSICKGAFQNCSGLTTATIGNSVTSIGYRAFDGCSGLTSLTIPNSVTSIGNSAFYGCGGLTSVTIGNSVTSIGESAFEGTPWLNNQPDGLLYINNVAYKYKGTMPSGTSISLGEGTVSISGECFNNCSGLTSIEIPNSVTSIGNSAFRNCRGLTSIEIPNSVNSIAYSTFIGCTGLTSVTIGNSVTSIGERAFFGCNGLKTVNWNAKNCSDFSFDSPFDGLSGITTFIFGNEVERIPALLCVSLSGLTSVTIGNSVTSIGSYAFYNCSGLTNLIWNAKNCSSNGYMPTSGITSATIGNEVEILPDNFLAGSKITEVTIPNSVTLIGSYAFYNCSGVTSWTIPNSITEIGEKAFDGTLWYNNQQDGLIYVGKVAYKYKGSMPSGTSISLEEGTVSISGECFKNCSGLTSIEIPNSVTSIGSNAFYGCSGLTSVTIPYSVTSIGSYAFYGCSGLISILVESGNTKYDSRNNCNAIIETSTNSLLAGCKNTIIPNSVISIGDYAFSGCTGLTSVTIPNSVTSIGDGAFLDCSGLKTVTIPNSVTEIGTSAFCECRELTSVTIGNSVTKIGSYAFYNCSGVTSVTNYALTPQTIDDYVFYGADIANCKLYVWHESLDAYKDAPVWKDFDIQDMGVVEGVEVDTATKEVEGYYNLQGIRLNEPASGQVNIVRYKDGTSQKIVVKE